ncbi:MAG TPA: heavy metal translocating P-type ATPase [Candidatus Acidoferrales bacterium]|nr:heavy metal translocating P-type ATPase [Candidatus Acidoferrales bacterium]
MKAAEQPITQEGTETCLARSVVDTLAREPGLEAVTIDPAHEKISVATLGQVPQGGIETMTRRFTEKIQAARDTRTCTLLEGGGDCHICDMPLSPDERRNIIIRRDGGSTTIARATCPTAPVFWRWRDLPLKVVPRELEVPESAEEMDEHINEWKMQMVAAVLCGIFGLAGAFSPAPWKTIFYVAAYIAGSFYPVEEVWERLRERMIDVHFLMIAVAVGAACIGAWAEGATLLFLFSLSGALEHFALGRTQKEIRSLFRDAPKVATVIDRLGRESEMRVEEIRAGMRLLIKPGAQFPVDGEVAKGATAADESNLTGEATPVEKKMGETVLAGTINLWGAVEVIVTKPVSESALQRIIKLIREAQQQKAPSQRFTDKFSTGYTYFVLGLSLAMFFVWWQGFKLHAFSDVAGHSAFYRTMTLLVVSSPCALVLSIPSAVLAAIAFGARHGILFRGGAAVEKLAEVNVVALDKTGTLTTGELKVETIESFPAGRESDVARLAFSLEKLSTHPLARAITLYGKQKNLQPMELAQFESVTGHGLRAKWNGKDVYLGKRSWVESFKGGIPLTPALSPKGSEGGGSATAYQAAVPSPSMGARVTNQSGDSGVSEIWISGGDLLGRILLRDDIRPQASEVIDELRREHLQTVVLTGDRKAAAENLKERLHLDDVRAELKPEEKVAAIRELSEGKFVAMVGDGVNDAPSLAAAHIGVAMGARGADAALEQADVVLMHDRLENFLAAFRLSRRARRIIRTNLFISLGTVAVLVSFAMLGKIPLTIGVVGHEGSTVVVVMNSLRLLFGGKKA